MAMTGGVLPTIREFVREAFLYGEARPEVTDAAELVKTGIIDSINVLRLVDFVEETYEIELEPADITRFTSIVDITAVIEEKLAGS